MTVSEKKYCVFVDPNVRPDEHTDTGEPSCTWAENHFLTFLCWWVATGILPRIQRAIIVPEVGKLPKNEPRDALLLSKDVSLSIPYLSQVQGECVRTVTLGPPTALVLTGRYQDVIVSPVGAVEYYPARKIGAGFSNVDKRFASRRDEDTRAKEYIVHQVRDPNEPYSALFERLRSQLVATVLPKELAYDPHR